MLNHDLLGQTVFDETTVAQIRSRLRGQRLLQMQHPLPTATEGMLQHSELTLTGCDMYIIASVGSRESYIGECTDGINRSLVPTAGLFLSRHTEDLTVVGSVGNLRTILGGCGVLHKSFYEIPQRGFIHKICCRIEWAKREGWPVEFYFFTRCHRPSCDSRGMPVYAVVLSSSDYLFMVLEEAGIVAEAAERGMGAPRYGFVQEDWEIANLGSWN